MEKIRAEQIEALESLKEYNPKLMAALLEVVPELKGYGKKEDTKEYMDYVFKGVNWELQVLNATTDILNEQETRFSIDSMNEMVAHINDAYASMDEDKLAQLIQEDLLLFTKKLQDSLEHILL